MTDETLPLFPEGRERATEIFEPSRSYVLEILREHAKDKWRRTGQPVSANDIRHILPVLRYTGDQRILGAVFNRKDWKPVGKIETATERHAEFGATRQAILTYVPREAA